MIRQHSTTEDPDHTPQPTTPKMRRQSSHDTHNAIRTYGIGFIMFECGLEEINATAVRRLGFKDIGDPDAPMTQKANNIAEKVANVQGQTKVQLEQQLGESPGDTGTEFKVPPASKINEDNVSIHSWDSRVSLPSSSSTISLESMVKPLVGDSSGGILHLSTIWFNFAAPPPISIKRKVDFTR